MWGLIGEGVPDIILQLSLDGTILYINRVPGSLKPDELRGTSVYDFLSPAARPQIRRALYEVFERREARSLDMPIPQDDGSVRWYSASAGPLIIGGRVVAATVIARDMTAQRDAELALRESEARYRTLVEHAPEAIVVFDVDLNRFIDANPNACLLFGLTREQLLTRDPVQVSPPIQENGRRSDIAASEYIGAALLGEAPCFEWTHLHSSGGHVQCEVRLVLLPAKDHRLVRGSIIDIRGQRHLEHQIEQFQKLDTLGHIAGGIAHDFNNELTVITASVELLLAALPEGGPGRPEALEIRAAAARATQLTNHILSFARKHEPVRELVDLNTAVKHVAVMLGRVLGHQIVIERRLHEDGAWVMADRGQIDQILANLFLNARDAMPGGGVITVEVKTSRDGRGFTLRVSDTGMGMDKETAAKIFEPFFTTKPVGSGTGLGLSTVSMIVQEHGGRIEVASVIAEGTTFEVTLPAAEIGTTKPDG